MAVEQCDAVTCARCGRCWITAIGIFTGLEGGHYVCSGGCRGQQQEEQLELPLQALLERREPVRA